MYGLLRLSNNSRSRLFNCVCNFVGNLGHWLLSSLNYGCFLENGGKVASLWLRGDLSGI